VKNEQGGQKAFDMLAAYKQQKEKTLYSATQVWYILLHEKSFSQKPT